MVGELQDGASYNMHMQQRQACIRVQAACCMTVTAPLLSWRTQAAWAADSKHLVISELRDVVQKDFVQNQYYITGKLSPLGQK